MRNQKFLHSFSCKFCCRLWWNVLCCHNLLVCWNICWIYFCSIKIRGRELCLREFIKYDVLVLFDEQWGGKIWPRHKALVMCNQAVRWKYWVKVHDVLLQYAIDVWCAVKQKDWVKVQDMLQNDVLLMCGVQWSRKTGSRCRTCCSMVYYWCVVCSEAERHGQGAGHAAVWCTIDVWCAVKQKDMAKAQDMLQYGVLLMCGVQWSRKTWPRRRTCCSMVYYWCVVCSEAERHGQGAGHAAAVWRGDAAAQCPHPTVSGPQPGEGGDACTLWGARLPAGEWSLFSLLSLSLLLVVALTGSCLSVLFDLVLFFFRLMSQQRYCLVSVSGMNLLRFTCCPLRE